MFCSCGRKAKLGGINEVDVFQRGNPYVIEHYRIDYCVKSALKSLFSVHNEMFNVWTHLAPLFGMALLCVYSLSTWLYDSHWSDRMSFLVWVCSASFMLFSSSFFHLFGCVGGAWFSTGAALDYSAITTLIVGSYVPALHYMFYDRMLWQWVYIAVMLVLGVVCATVSLSATFQRPQYQGIRAALFIFLSLFGVVWVGPHAIYLEYADGASMLGLGSFVSRMTIMGLFYIGGAVIYATKCPEQWAPGKFDIFFHSHSLFHIAVVIAVLWNFSSIFHFHQFRLNDNQLADASDPIGFLLDSLVNLFLER